MLPVIEETTGLYGIAKNALQKYGCRIGRKPFIYTVSKFEAVDINTEEDFKIAEVVGKVVYGLGEEGIYSYCVDLSSIKMKRT